MSDPLRSKVYDAEFELRFIRDRSNGSIDFYGQTLELPPARKFGDLEAVQRYVDAVWDLDVRRDKYPTWRSASPKVIPRGRGDKAHYETASHRIAIPDHIGSYNSWAMDEIVVLHEIAHACTPLKGHGTEFCIAFMDLLEVCMGGTWKLLLMRALDQRGVPLS